ncbi:MAG: hypothetical protein AB7I38_09925 [Dehalococcoidia bacterium]
MQRARRTASFLACRLLLACALCFVACSGGDDESPPSSPTPTTAASEVTAVANLTPTPRPSPTPRATATTGLPVGSDHPGDEGFRAFVRRLDEGLQAQGAAAIKTRWKTIEVVCRAEDVPQRADGAFCEQAGERYQGLDSSTWRSSGGISPVDRVNARLDTASTTLHPEATDAFGDGAMRVYAVANSGAYRTVITAIITSPPDFGPQRPIRVTWLLTWEFTDGEWRATKIMFAYVLSEDLLEPTREGLGVAPGWERYQP